MAFNQTLNVDQGTLFQWDYLIRTNQTLIFDLTDYQIRGQVRKDYDSGAVLLTPSFQKSDALGKIMMTITPAQTSALTFSGDEIECVYDIEIYNGTDDVKRVVEGTMVIRKEVTK